MVESRRKGVLAFGKQTAKGTLLADPTYAVGKVSGGVGPSRDIADLPLTGSSAARRGRYVQRGRGGGTVTILAHPDALGLLLYEVCGSQAISGAGPYTHTFTLADDIPQGNPLTVWDMVGDDWWRLGDCYVDGLTIRGTSGENVLVELSLMSLQVARVAAPTYTLIEAEPRHKYIGSAVLLEADNATPVAVDNAESVELAITRAAELRYGARLAPSFVIPDRNVDFSTSIVVDTSGTNQGWDFLAAAHLGEVAATGDIDQGIGSGSFQVTFGRHPIDAARFLRIASNGANWEFGADRPQSDPNGGPVEMDVAGIVKRPAGGGTEVTITLVNDVAATY